MQSEKPLHKLMEDDLQHLVDVIEQKRIVHEGIQLSKQQDDADPLIATAERLQQHSEAIGADTLGEYLEALEDKAREGDLEQVKSLLVDINQEFESVRKILNED